MRSFLFLISLSLLLSGCVLTTGLREYDTEKVGIDTIRNALQDNYLGVRSISGRFDFSYSTASDRKRSSGYIYLSGADSLFLDIKGPLGETEALMFLDSDSVKAINYFDNIRIKGRSDENSIRRLTGMNINTSEFKEALYSISAGLKDLRIDQKEKDKIRLKAVISKTRHRIVILNKNLLITEVAEFKERELLYKKEYDYFITKKGHTLPKRIRVRSYNPPSKLTIFYTDLKVNEFKKTGEDIVL